MEDDLLEGRTAVRYDEQAPSGTPRDERLLDRPATGDELLVRFEGVGRREREGSWPWRRAMVGRSAIRVAVAAVRRASVRNAIAVRIRGTVRIAVPGIGRSRPRRAVSTWRARRSIVRARRTVAAWRSGWSVIRTRRSVVPTPIVVSGRSPGSVAGFAVISPRATLIWRSIMGSVLPRAIITVVLITGALIPRPRTGRPATRRSAA